MSSTSSSLLPVPLLVLCIIILLSPSDIHAASFNCTSSSTCISLVGYVPPNSTTLSAIATLFNLTQSSSILGPNKLPPSTPSNHAVPANETLIIPFNCSCSRGVGFPTTPPIYTVVSGDGLSHIAEDVFSRLVTYQEIQNFNGMPDPNKIDVGQKLHIPLPCSCDEVEGQRVVHYAYIVPSGESLDGIARKYGVSEVTLQRRNNLTAPTDLKAASVLDVPLRACSSAIARGIATGSSNETCDGTGSPTPAAPSPSSAASVRTSLDGRRWNQKLHLLLILHGALLCVSL